MLRPLRDHPRVTVTAHIGSATVETRRAMGGLAIDNLIAHQQTGALLTPVPESAAISDSTLWKPLKDRNHLLLAPP